MARNGDESRLVTHTSELASTYHKRQDAGCFLRQRMLPIVHTSSSTSAAPPSAKSPSATEPATGCVQAVIAVSFDAIALITERSMKTCTDCTDGVEEHGVSAITHTSHSGAQ